MKQTYLFLSGLFILHLYLLYNLQFTLWPEMLSYSYLANNNFSLYRDMIMPYPPLLIWILQIIYKIFGYEVWIIKTFVWLIILLSDLLIYKIIKLITKNNKPAFAGLYFYIILQPLLEGNMLWFDNMIVLPLLIGLYFILKNKYLYAGLALGIAILIKQTAGVFLVLTIFYLLYKNKYKYIYKLLLIPIIFGISLLVWLIMNNNLAWFLNWTLIYPFAEWSNFPGYVQMNMNIIDKEILCLLLIPGIFFALKIPKKIILIFLFGSLISIYPRFSFFHFQTALAILSIIFGYFFCKYKYLYLFILILLLYLISPRLKLNWQKETRFFNEDNIKASEIISKKTENSNSVYLLGLHSSYYVFANMLPPKPWFDNFGWYLEIDGVQEQIIARWENNSPEYVYWDLDDYQPEKITNWIKEYYNEEGNVNENISLWEIKN